MTHWIQIASIASIAAAIAVAVYCLVAVRPAPMPELGLRGLRRRQGLGRGGSWPLVEPLVRRIGGWISHVPIEGLRRSVSEQIRLSGEHLGLTADELIALCLLCGAVATGLSLGATTLLSLPTVAVFFVAAIGLYLPYARVVETSKRRFTDVERALPGAIDLGALCMGAGQDFPGAIRQVVATSPSQADPLAEELSRVLQEIELGKTRRAALLGFQERVPIPIVRDFVGAVVQSEQKGNPLADVLRIQATVLRMRRSTMLEEAASRSASLMMLPMALMMLSVISLLVGPMAVTLGENGL
jgi:tight adherence protein C